MTDRLPGQGSEAGAAAYRTTLQQWIDVTVGPSPLVGTPPLPGGGEDGSLSAVVRRMAALARHDARWARHAPSGVSVIVVGTVLAVLLRRYPPSVAVLVTAVALACPLAILPASSALPAAVRRAAAVGRRPAPGHRRPSAVATLLAALLVAAAYAGGRHLAASLAWRPPTLAGFGQPVMPEGPVPTSMIMDPLQGVGVGLTLGAALTLGSVAVGVVLAAVGAVVRRSRARCDVVVALAAPTVEALHRLPHDSSPLDPEDKAAVLAPMRRLASNLEVTLPRLLPVSGRREQRDLEVLSVAAARAVRSWEPLVVISNPDRIRILRANLEAVLAGVLNGDYADLPVARDSRSGVSRRRWTSVLGRLLVVAVPLALAALVGGQGRPITVPASVDDALRVFCLAWVMLGVLMTVDGEVPR